MVNYRRLKITGATYFFTVTLYDRTSTLLTDHVDLLQTAMQQTKSQHPYQTKAFVILPDHLHVIWQLPPRDDNFSIRWKKIKTHFTRNLIKRGFFVTKNHRNEYNVWQRRFWEHVIRNEDDYKNHINYIHYNPIKHHLVTRTRDWPHSSFHHFVRKGLLPIDWSDNVTASKFMWGE
jgi:putative transposase